MNNFDNQYAKGNLIIAGIDEAGRGPLAGPVAVGCVIMPLDAESIIAGVNDSKKLSKKKRDELYCLIKERAIAYSVVFIDEKTIDEINILNATKLGMQKALSNLELKPDKVLIDAVKIETSICEVVAIIKGDAKSYNIACASILAKVERDAFMEDLSKLYPLYGFEKHKGYGTKLHIEKLKLHGACLAHRKSFIKNFI